jgi:hypothetical protein
MTTFWIAGAISAVVLLTLVALAVGLDLTHASDREAREKRETGEMGGER